MVRSIGQSTLSQTHPSPTVATATGNQYAKFFLGSSLSSAAHAKPANGEKMSFVDWIKSLWKRMTGCFCGGSKTEEKSKEPTRDLKAKQEDPEVRWAVQQFQWKIQTFLAESEGIKLEQGTPEDKAKKQAKVQENMQKAYDDLSPDAKDVAKAMLAEQTANNEVAEQNKKWAIFAGAALPQPAQQMGWYPQPQPFVAYPQQQMQQPQPFVAYQPQPQQQMQQQPQPFVAYPQQQMQQQPQPFVAYPQQPYGYAQQQPYGYVQPYGYPQQPQRV